MFNMNVELNEEEVLVEVRDCRGIKFILDTLDINESTLLDEYYFSEILDEAINRDEAEVVSDINSSSLDVMLGEKFDPELEYDVMRFIKKAILSSKNKKQIYLGIKNIAKEFGWDITFTKTTTI